MFITTNMTSLQIITDLNTCFTRAIAKNDVHAVVFLVGCANNITQQHPDYINALKASTDKIILVFFIDPVMEDPPLFAASLNAPMHIKNDTWEQHVIPGIRFLTFRTNLYLNDNVWHEDSRGSDFDMLKNHVEMCMKRDIMFLYSSFTGMDSFVLQERMHAIYGNDERFNRLCDFGSVVDGRGFGVMASTCMIDPNMCPPIFSPDMKRVYAIDTMTITELVALKDTFPDNEQLHKRIRTVIVRKIRYCVETDGVVLRNYIVGNVAYVQPYILKHVDLTGEPSMIPFNIVRDYLLIFCTLIPDENERAMYEYCVRDIVNMTKENRYEWFTMIKNIFEM